MTMTVEDRRALEALEVRLRAILPEEYQDAYEDVQPVSMGSAGLKYGADGKVAWNEIWAKLLRPRDGGRSAAQGHAARAGVARGHRRAARSIRQVVEEICRGVSLVTGLAAQASPIPGWVRVTCLSDAMAGWLLRAIVMENVAARADGAISTFPPAPHFRLEKEIKNVVTVIAKTCHYWTGPHAGAPSSDSSAICSRGWRRNHRSSSPLLRAMPRRRTEHQATVGQHGGDASSRDTGLRRHGPALRRLAWPGMPERPRRGLDDAMLVASNVLSRREGTTLFVPINPAIDPGGDAVVTAIARIHAFASARGMLQPPAASQPPA